MCSMWRSSKQLWGAESLFGRAVENMGQISQGQTLSCIGEGNGNPLQCCCLENPMDGEAWQAAVHGVAQSRTRLKRLSSSSSSSSSRLLNGKVWIWETHNSRSQIYHRYLGCGLLELEKTIKVALQFVCLYAKFCILALL